MLQKREGIMPLENPLENTRLYELLLWIVSGLMGFLLTGYCSAIFIPWAISNFTTNESQLESPLPPKIYTQVHQFKKMPEITDDQLDELISLEKQIIEHQHNQQNKPKTNRINWFVVSLFILCAALLIALSIYYNSIHIISLILAMWGALMFVLNIMNLLNSITFCVFAAAISISCYFLSRKIQLVALQVIASIMLSLFLSSALYVLKLKTTTVEKLFTLERPKHLIPDRTTFNKYWEKKEILQQQAQELLAKGTLTNQEKRSYFATFKEIDHLESEFNDLREAKTTKQARDAWEYADALYKSQVFLILMSIYALLAILIPHPMFVQFSFIFLAAEYCLMCNITPGVNLDYTHSITYYLYSVLLFLFLCLHLYRQKRYCPAR